ncbi:MAG TPA: sortase [Candidatus Woesebacteria bacterium]|nr:sortase [Candidatus Woesebacteria bacterium]
MHLSQKPFIYTGLFLWLSAIILALLPSWPHLFYRLFPQTSGTLASTIASTVSSENLPSTSSAQIISSKLPDIDPSLPKENGLIIDKIGVKGEIHEGDNWQEILKTGIWRVPDFGTPENTSRPIIIAAHRWGYLDWSAAFRKLNSFYSLPKLVVGDTITIYWNQRPFEYKVYSTSSGTKITEYNANLILYTCQMWNSPERFFVYANRVN